jgi:MFS family permease
MERDKTRIKKSDANKVTAISNYRWIILFSSFYAFVTYAFALQIVPPLMNSLIKEFNVTHGYAGLLMSLVVIPGIFLALPAGIFADHYGVKLAGSISAIMVLLGCATSALANSFTMLLAGRIILGLGGAFIATTMPTIISQWFPRSEIGKAMGIFGMNMPFASVIAFPAASILLSKYNWRYPFYISTFLAMLNVVTFMVLIREGPFKKEVGKPASLRTALRNVEIWKVGAVWLLFNASALSFTTWSPEIFEKYMGIESFYASLLASTLMLAAIPFVPFFGWYSDRIRKRRKLMVIGSMLMAGTLIAIAYLSSPYIIIPVVALGIAAALIPPMVMALPPEILGHEMAGTGFGIVAVCLNVGIAVAPPLTGLIIDITLSPTLTYLSMALFSTLATGVAYTLKTK